MRLSPEQAPGSRDVPARHIHAARPVGTVLLARRSSSAGTLFLRFALLFAMAPTLRLGIAGCMLKLAAGQESQPRGVPVTTSSRLLICVLLGYEKSIRFVFD